MSEEDKKSKLKSLIEDYEIGYKESKYEGDVEEYKSLKETHKLLKDTLNYIEKLQKVINLMYQDIESEYLGTSYMEYYSLENYYRRAEEEE